MNRWELPKLKNTRDIGGLDTTDGRVICEGKLIRSGKLHKLPKKTVHTLQKRGVSLVIDLRIEHERASAPDTVWDNCKFVHIPILWFPTPGITADYNSFTATVKGSARAKQEGERIKREFGNTDNYMLENYRSMLFDEGAKEGLRRFLRLVIEEEGCVLWHCASGKDRAGICSMLLEALLGVDEDTILADYMLSQKYCRKKYFFNRMALSIAPIRLSMKKVLFGLMRTKELYLKTMIDEIKERYGSVTEYCKAELSITDEDILKLKDKYLI